MGSLLTSYYRLPFDWEESLGSQLSVCDHGFRLPSKGMHYCATDSGVEIGANSFGNLDQPFNISELVEDLRREHYVKNWGPQMTDIWNHPIIRRSYYLLRHIMPSPVRQLLQRSYFYGWKKLPFPDWPLDSSVDKLHKEYLRLCMKAKGVEKVPFVWFWPEGAPSALIITHDVETAAGRDFTSRIMDIDASHGFKASVQVVPEKRYEVPDQYVQEIRSRGFEFNVHDLNHDGNLYRDHDEFLRRAKKINQYLLKYDAKGFRSGVMYRNLDWYDAFDFSYDMSVPNVAHLEPQRGGCCTVMPYYVGKIVEIPLTTTQDYTLFHILKDYSIDLWKRQIDLIRQENGLISFIAHPDYLIEDHARATFEKLLAYLVELVEQEKIWAALPGDVDRWWRARSEMTLVENGNGWEITGPESHRARLAYACMDGDEIYYELAGVSVRDGVHS